jgi:hypothetical protein
MRKRIGVAALTACLLSFGAVGGVSAQHKGHGNNGNHGAHGAAVRQEHVSKKQAKQIEHVQKKIAHEQAKAVRANQRAVRNVVVTTPRTVVVRTPVYRYVVSGVPRSTSRPGALLLRRAVSDGYTAGYLAGHNDLAVHSGFGFVDENGYRVALYGYSGGSVPQSDYQYYYREGYERGYDDGYYQRSRFGTVSSGKAAILATAVNAILGFALR